jgi:serine/threonine protein phosphatase PrpC
MVYKMTAFETGYANDIGRKRSENQDRILLKSMVSQDEAYALIAVADGMGGLSGGAEAAQICVDSLADLWSYFALRKNFPDLAEMKQKLFDQAHLANKAVREASKKQGNMMGSTCTFVFLHNNEYIVFHAGDTRLYLFGANQADTLTNDHSWVEENEDEDEDYYPPEGDEKPHSNKLTNFFGTFRNFSLDMRKGTLKGNEILVLCSDGFYKRFTRTQLAGMFTGAMNLQYAINNIVARIYKEGADDNISVIALRCVHYK